MVCIFLTWVYDGVALSFVILGVHLARASPSTFTYPKYIQLVIPHFLYYLCSFRGAIHSLYIPGAYITVGFGIQQRTIYIFYIPKVCIRIRIRIRIRYRSL